MKHARRAESEQVVRAVERDRAGRQREDVVGRCAALELEATIVL